MGLYISHARGHASSKEIMCPGSAVHKQWMTSGMQRAQCWRCAQPPRPTNRARLRTEIVNANGEIREDDI